MFSNREWIWQVDDRILSPYEDMIKKREAFGLDGLEEDLNISKIFYYLMDIPEFKEKYHYYSAINFLGEKRN